MKLLIITQKVNQEDPILGFFHQWLLEFAKHVEQLTVIGLEVGGHNLPANVRVLSLGKEKGLGKLGRTIRLYSYIWKYRHDYESVFVHMNQIYVVLCGVVWRLMGKKISLWYAHGSVSFSLRLAVPLVHHIFTSTAQGFNIRTKKKQVVGQGIDTTVFVPDLSKKTTTCSLLTVSRISPIKNQAMIIRALLTRPDAELTLVGEPITEVDRTYQQTCVELADTLGVADRVHWVGSKTNLETIQLYQVATVTINMSNTKSLDKVILESIACGTPVISSNESARSIQGVTHIPCTQEVLNETLQTFDAIVVAPEAIDAIKTQHGLSRLITHILTTLTT